MKKEILQTTDERFLLSAMQHGDLKAYLHIHLYRKLSGERT